MPRRSWWWCAGVVVLAVALGCSAKGGSAPGGKVPLLRAVQRTSLATNAVADATPASFVITSPQGVKVFLDVTVVPEDLDAALDDPKNVFVITHNHADHSNPSLLTRFKGQKLRGDAHPAAREGAVVWTAESGDVKVQAIASSHLDDQADGRTNVIVVVDVAGVRVVHMGDCGQTALSADQLPVIGRPDVMIHLLEDVLNSEADTANQKAFKLVDQAAPKVLVPTHIASEPAVKLLEARGYPADVPQKDELPLTPALLGKQRAVFMGVNRAVAEKAGVKASGEI